MSKWDSGRTCYSNVKEWINTTFKKQFPQSLFLNALSSEWQKTSEIRDKVGCSQKLAKDTLNSLFEDGLIEWKPAKGGREGTREWRLKGE